VSLPRARLAHLAHLTDDTGVFEHALGSVPRRANGWCTDDNGRGLALVCSSDELEAERLADTYLAFLLHAHAGEGRFRLRMAYDRHWTLDPSSDDANARALLGLAVAAARGPEPLRWAAAELFSHASVFRSRHPRATARAAIAAAELAYVEPGNVAAENVLYDAARTLPRPIRDTTWPWPAPRLTYENAILPEALIATGEALGHDELVADGLRLLTWLVQEETRDERFSFTPVGGRSLDDPRPAFDQQPIEAAAMAEACARAFEVTGDGAWLLPLERAAAWVCGDNDAGVALLDPPTGAGFDGLQADGANRNQGGESTIVVLSVLQLAHRLLPAESLESLWVVERRADQREAASAASR
jgi:hypothetical protein